MVQRVHRAELLEQTHFWAAHMWNITRGPIASGDPEIADGAFGLSSDSIGEFYVRELRNESKWPYFQIRLDGGYSIEVEYANFTEDHEIIYQVCHNEWPSPICIGKGGGHWLLPAFRWTELLQISQNVAASGQTRHAGSHALLLLLPTAWWTQSEDLNDIRRRLLEAWNALSLFPHSQGETLVEQLVVAGESKVRWQPHAQFGWINDGSNSRRNPACSASLTTQEFDGLRAFLLSLAHEGR